MFYTYLWLREDCSPYYVGKGTKNRAFISHRSQNVFRPKSRDSIKVQYWPDEATAFAYEMYQIDFWGRKDIGTGVLHNHTDGGEGPSGHKRSVESRKKISIILTGRKLSTEHIENSRKARIGSKQSEAHAQHSRTAALGRKHTEEELKKMSESQKGRTFSEETLQKMSVAMSSIWQDKKEKGYKTSEEHRKNLSIAAIRILENERARRKETNSNLPEARTDDAQR